MAKETYDPIFGNADNAADKETALSADSGNTSGANAASTDGYADRTSAQEGAANTPSPEKPSVLISLIKGLCYFVAFYAAQFVTGMLMGIVFGTQKSMEDMAAGAAPSPDALAEYINEALNKNANLLVIVYTVILLLFLLIFFAIRRKKFLQEVRLKKISAKSVPALLILPVGLVLFVNGALNLLPAEWLSSYAESSASLLGMSAFGLALLSNAVCAPLSEEITFRGLMLSRFDRAIPKWVGILLTSFIFGLVHGQIIWICYATLLGVVFGLVAEHEGTILASLILHVIFNLLGTILSYSGLSFTPVILIAALLIGLVLTALGFYLLFRNPAKRTPEMI